ncbi:MAG: TetR/AcrR family transcriptional regulator [Acidimicrobiales bacterium]
MINAATRELLSDVGFVDLTIEAVARRAGVGKPTIYRRHASKAALVAAALMEVLEGTNPEVPDTGDVRLDARQLLANLARAVNTEFGTAVREILSPAARDLELQSLFDAAVTERRTIIRTVMRRAEDERRLLAADVETAIDLALGAIYFRYLFTAETLDDQFVGRVVDSVIAPN